MKNSKRIVFSFSAILFAVVAFAQTSTSDKKLFQLPIIFMREGISLHFISPEPIQFVDISTDYMVGDLPSENVARVKVDAEKESEEEITEDGSLVSNTKKYKEGESLGIVTVAGQSFLAQYNIVYKRECDGCVVSNISIQAEDMQPLEYPKAPMSHTEMWRLSKKIMEMDTKKPIRKDTNLKLTMALNNIYVVDDYIFLDITIENKSNLACNVEDIKFSIEDKKIYKATNNQSILVKPIYSLYNPKRFRKTYRNVFVFRKFTYPNSKVLLIRFIEDQISGRTIDMKVKYSDVLDADTL